MRPSLSILFLLGLLAACSETTEQKAPPPVAPLPKAAQPAPPTTEVAVPLVDSAFLADTRAKEAVQLRAHRTVVRRDGNRLLLKLTNGKEHVLTDVMAPADSAVVFDFVQHYPRQGYYLVHYTPYEGYGYVLVSQRTGEWTGIPEAPVFSPDSTRFVIAYGELDSPVSAILEVYRFTARGLKREFMRSPNHWGPANPRWLDSTTIQFERVALTNTGKKRGTDGFLLKMPNDQWRMAHKE